RSSLKCGSMEVDVSPFTSLPLPDSGLFKRNSLRSVVSHLLTEPDVRYDRDISHQANLGGRHGGLLRAAAAAQLKIKMVKGQALKLLPFGLRLESRQRRIAQFLVRSP